MLSIPLTELWLCVAYSTIRVSTNRHPAYLYVDAGDVLYSEEGTTQGDPLAMPFSLYL